MTGPLDRYHPLVDESVIQAANDSWTRPGGCRDLVTECYDTGSSSTCGVAQIFCVLEVFSPLAGPYDPYYVPTLLANETYPYAFSPYLETVRSKIGADPEVVYQDMSYLVYSYFLTSGDYMRSTRSYLEIVINSGVRTVIFDGDAVRCQSDEYLNRLITVCTF